MPNIGAPELLIILILVLLVFGGAKLPKLARSLGQAQREFKDGLSDAAEEGESASTGGSAKAVGQTGEEIQGEGTSNKNSSA